MVKQILLCFVVAIAMTVAGYYLCQNEGFKLHYCALLFVSTFSAMICTCAIWFDIKNTLEGYSKISRRSIISDNIAFTIMAWLLPAVIFIIGIL